MKKIETNSNALDYRIFVHKHFSKSNFDSWVIDNLHLGKKMKILDVGCGTGNHSFDISKKVGPKGMVIGTDISKPSLDKCREKISEDKIKNISVLRADLTKMSEKLSPLKFDRILSSFAIYYTKDPEKTFKDLYGLLENKGIIFICGPTKKNNLEFLELVKKAGGNFSNDFYRWSEFLENTAKKILEKLFPKIEIEYFNNPVEFPNKDVLFKYWEATPLYNKNIEGRMRELIEKEFAKKKTFISNKIIIGIKCQKI